MAEKRKDYDIYEEYLAFEFAFKDLLYRYLFNALNNGTPIVADEVIEIAEDGFADMFYAGALSASDMLDEEFIDIAEDIVQEAINRVQSDGLNFADRIREYDGQDPTECSEKLERIFATDGHRCFTEGQISEANLFTQVYKIWDATMDSKTRDTHVDLNGTRIPVDEYFETPNGKAYAPSLFGVAEEDVNCRCILQFEKGVPT